MNKSEIRARKASEALSCVRNLRGFTVEELTNALKKQNCPYPGKIVEFLKQQKLILAYQKGYYNFSNSEPIYFGTIRPYLDRISSDNLKYTKKWHEKKKGVVVSSSSSPVLDLTEEKAIKFLKTLGYRIQRSVSTWEEV